MASNHRKMLFPHQPGKDVSFTFFFPFFQNYPPPPPPPPPPAPPQRDLFALLSTSICIIGSVLLLIFLTVFLYLYTTQSRRRSPAAVAPVDTSRREDENEERNFSSDHHVWRVPTAGLHRSAINSITVVVFNKEEGIIDGTDCSVCLSEFEQDETLRLLPKCSHAFHVNCIDTWLLSHKNCPLCRAPVFPTESRNKRRETTNHQSESGGSNDGEEESSGTRNGNVLPRAQSDLIRHCRGAGRFETVRRSFSIGGSSPVKTDGSDGIASTSRRQFFSSFSANFSSSRRARNQDSVLPNRMPSVSG